MLLLLGLAACYGFSSGGGLPPEIRTVAVLPFENQTPEPVLTAEVSEAVRRAVENRLGLRGAAEDQADAVVRGVITRYDPDQPVAFTGDQQGNVNVQQRLLAITLNVEIQNVRANRLLWQRNGLTVNGQYQTGSEPEGRRRALELLTTEIVNGAQSQW